MSLPIEPAPDGWLVPRDAVLYDPGRTELWGRALKDRRDPWREIVIDYTMICIWCGLKVEATDIVDVWAHVRDGRSMCEGYRKVDGTGRVSETWAEPTMWKDGDPESEEVPF